jgi:chemotaxis family two-component system response regulator Rcp1
MQPDILYVEDNPADVFLLREAMYKLDKNLNMVTIGDGEAAIAFLNEMAVPPCVIILDIGLPKLDGAAVLKVVKSTPEFSGVPTVVFADTAARRRIQNSGPPPDLFLNKPGNLEGYNTIATQILALCGTPR